MKKHFIYILECKDKTLYTGYTTDINKRLDVHNKGKGAKYTRGRIPVKLVYMEEWNEKESALRRECNIKKLTKKQKLELIHDYFVNSIIQNL